MLSDKLLTENDVVDAVRLALQRRNWKIESWASTAEAGIDIHATRLRDLLLIEAKGVTSSKSGSARYGTLMTSTQFFIQVAAALLKTAELRSANPSAEVAIAVPNHSRMRERIRKIEPVLMSARIGVLWVSNDLQVTAWNLKW
jgi:hypothetical protein